MIITRFAPSPTGNIHIGNIKIAFFSWILSKKYNGGFFLRIDDTDLSRFKLKYIKNIIYKINLFKFFYFKKIIYQTNKLYRYNEIIQYLLNKKFLYFSCENILINNLFWIFKNLNKFIFYKKNLNKFFLKKNIKLKSIIKFFFFKNKIKDIIKKNNIILIKSSGIPVYNFSSIIDDLDMNINYVIRGIDHLDNIYIQINILIILKKKLPNFIHIPIILNISGNKISKRCKEKQKFFLKKFDYLPESILSYLINNKNLNKIFYIKNIIFDFNLININKSYIRFDQSKINWFDRIYIKFFKINYIYNIIKKYLIKVFFKKKIFLKNFKIFINLYKKNLFKIKNLYVFIIKIFKYNFFNTNLITHFFDKNIFLAIIFIKNNISNIFRYNINFEIFIKIVIKKFFLKKFKFLTFFKLLIFGKKNISNIYMFLNFFQLNLLKKKILILIKNLKLILIMSLSSNG